MACASLQNGKREPSVRMPSRPAEELVGQIWAASWRPGRDDDQDRKNTGSLSVSKNGWLGSSLSSQDKWESPIYITYIINIYIYIYIYDRFRFVEWPKSPYPFYITISAKLATGIWSKPDSSSAHLKLEQIALQMPNHFFRPILKVQLIFYKYFKLCADFLKTIKVIIEKTKIGGRLVLGW